MCIKFSTFLNKDERQSSYNSEIIYSKKRACLIPWKTAFQDTRKQRTC